MDCRSTYPENSFDDKFMIDLDSSSGGYPREVFAIGDENAGLTNHDGNDPVNTWGPAAPAARDSSQPPLMTTQISNPNGVWDLKSIGNLVLEICMAQRLLLVQEALLGFPTIDRTIPDGKGWINSVTGLAKEAIL